MLKTPVCRRVAKAAASLGLSVLALATLAACGPSGQSSGQGADASKAFHQGFDKSFNDAFARSTHDSCVTSALSKGAASDKAERYCSCVVAQLAPLSVDQKQHFDVNSAQAKQIVATCQAQSQ